MTRPAPPAAIGEEEALARYIFFRGHVRADGTIKPDALIPHPYPDLSVTRHHGLDATAVWAAGRVVGERSQRSLIGRADLRARDYRSHKLVVRAEPVEGNLHHAVVVGWPAEKPAQKNLAQQLAIRARYESAPVA